MYAGQTYTLSCYVNTAQCTAFAGDGVYLKVTGCGVDAVSEAVNYPTASAMDGGWVRISVTFTPTVKGNCTVTLYNNGAGPYFFADDFQLEYADTPSNLNLLENGSLQYWGHGWKTGIAADFHSGTGLFAQGDYAYSLRIIGDAYTESHMYQDVPIHKTGKTYVLSGWAKANAVPDNKQTATGDEAAALDKHKQFGLRAIITYSDNTTEYHYVPFNPDITDWQYVSTAIVPRKATTAVETIRVVCAYERNGNAAYFDNLSLTEEAAQTMKYDKDGNLVSVKSTGTPEETAAFDGSELRTLNTGGSGTFTYTYDEAHNPTSVTNGVVKSAVTYDGSGNPLTSTLSAEQGGSNTLVSTTAYTGDDNRVSSVTARGNTTTYNYAGALAEMLGLPTSVTAPDGVVSTTRYDVAGRPLASSVGKGSATYSSVVYNYTKSMLTSVARSDGSKTQTYTMTYDAFGNMLHMAVGTRSLMTYLYGANNGLLEKQTYANGDSVSFAYDHLGRTTETSTSDGDTYTYRYTGDGQLHEMTDQAENITYRYGYDTLGRLITTSQAGSVDLRAG